MGAGLFCVELGTEIIVPRRKVAEAAATGFDGGMTSPDWKKLEALLERRLEIISDREWYARDAAEHLAALQSVSDALSNECARLRPQLPPRLRHFLDQASFNKALDWIRDSQ